MAPLSPVRGEPRVRGARRARDAQRVLLFERVPGGPQAPVWRRQPGGLLAQAVPQALAGQQVRAEQLVQVALAELAEQEAPVALAVLAEQRTRGELPAQVSRLQVFPVKGGPRSPDALAARVVLRPGARQADPGEPPVPGPLRARQRQAFSERPLKQAAVVPREAGQPGRDKSSEEVWPRPPEGGVRGSPIQTEPYSKLPRAHN